MDIEILKQEGNEMQFIVKGITPVLANTLRRMIITEVPTLAVDEVNFLKNESALYDEIIAHRLGLLPLKTDLKSYDIKEKCSCKGKGCAKCQLNLTLKAKGPCTVYSHDLESQDPKVKVIYENMPITKLIKDQKLELEAVAKLGQGKEHAKFSPCFVVYRAYPKIKIDNKQCVNSCNKCVESCPKKVLEKRSGELSVKDLLSCDLCRQCLEVCNNDAIKIEDSKEDFIFEIENFGQLTIKEILEQASKIFDEKLDEFEEALKDTKTNQLSKITSKIKKKK